jgi:RNA polymerase sigma-70 factor (ECF subfamily)
MGAATGLRAELSVRRPARIVVVAGPAAGIGASLRPQVSKIARTVMANEHTVEDGITVDEVSCAADLHARFVAFVRTHRARARGLAWRLVGGDESAADDVTQDALLKAYRALDGFREEASLETWFYRILVRQAHSYRRWRGIRELWTLGGEHDPADPAPCQAGDPALRRRIAKGLDRLSRRQREAFVLIHLEGYTVREAAELLEKPEGTVKSHLHRALRSLREELGDLVSGDQ